MFSPPPSSCGFTWKIPPRWKLIMPWDSLCRHILERQKSLLMSCRFIGTHVFPVRLCSFIQMVFFRSQIKTIGSKFKPLISPFSFKTGQNDTSRHQTFLVSYVYSCSSAHPCLINHLPPAKEPLSSF